MYLTRMALNGTRRQARHLLSSPQNLHAAVLGGFADSTVTEDGRVLWRLDARPPHKLLLYVVSPQAPDFTHIVEQAGWPTTETWQTREYVPFLNRLQKGQRWHFRITANPTRSTWVEGERGKVQGHVTPDQQQEWLQDRADRNGFELSTCQGSQEPDVAVMGRESQAFRRGSGKVTISTATFEGNLVVAEPDEFRRALTHGIGRAKAYGCGLMTLALTA
jgi:CRISPR system Cascade subunit CasE